MLTPFVKTLAAQAITRPGLPRLLHKLFFADKLAIVTYHGIVQIPLEVYNWSFIDIERFRAQVTYLGTYFEVIPLSEAIDALRHGKINRPTAVITFDDGYHSNYSIAFPILRDLGLPATIFLTTGLINTDDTLWDLRLNRSLRDTTKHSLSWKGINLDLNGSIAKTRAKVEVRSRLKELPPALLSSELGEVIKALGDDPARPIEVDSPFRMLNTEAIAEMAASGLIEFGAHSHTHPVLSRLSRQECQEEIERSIKTVRMLTGRPCELFAYPFGGRQDYNQNAIDILRSLGIRAAATTSPGPNDKNASPLELRRYGAGAGENMTLFQLKVHHLRTWGSQPN